MRRRFLASAVAGTIAIGTLVAVGGAAGAVTGAPSCAELHERVAQVPLLRERIRTIVEDLEGEISEVRDPVRRNRRTLRFQPRIDALRGLDARLVGEVAAIGERCGTSG